MGVLVAISIPIFTSQLEKAREATDAENIRSAYAELAADALTGDAVTASTEGKITINAAAKDSDTLTATVELTQQQDGWQDTSITKIGSMDAGSPKKGGTATITITRATGAAALTY